MNIYLVQHGKPVPKDQDPERPLSDQGRDEVTRVSGALRSVGVAVAEIIHSGKLRARETAEILAAALSPEGSAVQREQLGPLDEVGVIAGQIQQRSEDLMIVGHLPHLSQLASRLTADDRADPVVLFQQGGVVCLRPADGGWAVAWVLVPEIVAE